MGHVHLKVADIEPTVGFYRDVLGFGADGAAGPPGRVPVSGRLPPSPGRERVGEPRRRHRRRPAPPPSATPTILLPDAAELARVAGQADAAAALSEQEETPMVTDPAGNRLALIAA